MAQVHTGNWSRLRVDHAKHELKTARLEFVLPVNIRIWPFTWYNILRCLVRMIMSERSNILARSRPSGSWRSLHRSAGRFGTRPRRHSSVCFLSTWWPVCIEQCRQRTPHEPVFHWRVHELRVVEMACTQLAIILQCRYSTLLSTPSTKQRT